MKNPDDAPKERGVSASNADFSHFDQVAKDQRYRLAEGGGEESFDEDFEVRTCDMAGWFEANEADRSTFAQKLGQALEEIGFAILVGHGIDPDVHEGVAAAARQLFTEVPLETRLRFTAERAGSVKQGYFPIAETSDIHPDMVEGWVFCRRAFRLASEPDGAGLERFWPDLSLEPPLRRLVEANERLILPVMQAMLRHLGVDPHLYDEKLTKTNIGLRLNYYPPVPASAPPGAGRLLGHEDVGMFTFLPAPQVEGLQVLNRKNMSWIRLAAPPGSIILNTGDYVQRITNDVFPSTTHRVSRPRNPADHARERITYPMNVYVWEDELLEVLPGLGEPRYPPIKAITFHTASTAKFYGDDYAV